MQRARFFFAFSAKKTEATAEPGAARPGARKKEDKHKNKILNFPFT